MKTCRRLPSTSAARCPNTKSHYFSIERNIPKMSVRIGFVGCGGMANSHMSNLNQIEDAELVGFTDIVTEKAEAAAEEYGGKAYESHQAMYEDADLDAVYICVPPFAHEDQEILAAQAGLAIFVEKPVALSMDKAREIEAAIADSGVVNCVGYHWRYLPNVQEIKQRFSPDDVAMAMGYWVGGFPGVHWWRVMDQSGGQMVEQTTHIVDLCRYLVGEVDTVYAEVALRSLQDVEDMDVPDVGAATLKFSNGAVGMICSSCCATGGGAVGLHLEMKDAWVEVSPNRLVINDKEISRTVTRSAADHARGSEIFIQAVTANDQSLILSDYTDGTKSLAISLAANKSAATGQPVRPSEM